MDYSTLLIFGCLTYSLVDSQKKELARVQVKEVLLHRFHQRNQGIQALRSREDECLC